MKTVPATVNTTMTTIATEQMVPKTRLDSECLLLMTVYPSARTGRRYSAWSEKRYPTPRTVSMRSARSPSF